jgi:predicted adenylyl cyclase CyaB
MREIEVKAKVRSSEAILNALKEKGIELGQPIKQHDVVYSQPGAKDNQPNSIWLRIRTENDKKITLTLKQQVTNELDSIEHEVVVDNADEMFSIITLLGYELFSDLTKVRQKAKHGDIEICYDTLPDLGTFIEAEKLCPDDADAKAITTELWRLLSELGVSKNDEETSGYDVLLRRKEGLSNG